MKHTVRLTIEHPDKSRVEYFLNRLEASLEQIPFDARQLMHTDEITAGFMFKVKDGSTSIIVIFATSYFHANAICTANSSIKPNLKWTINGAILFGVESTDEEASAEMLSFFAGRE